MGVIIKFFLFFLVTYLILRSIGRLLFGIRYKQNTRRYGTPAINNPVGNHPNSLKHNKTGLSAIKRKTLNRPRWRMPNSWRSRRSKFSRRR